MNEAIEFAKVESPERVLHALEAVFRRLLANLLMNSSNPTFRKVRPENKAVQQHTAGLKPEFIQFLFHSLGFSGTPDSDGFIHFTGDEATLKSADSIFSAIENTINDEKQKEAEFFLSVLSTERKRAAEARADASNATKETRAEKARQQPSCPQQRLPQSQLPENSKDLVFHSDDFLSVEDLKPVVRNTLLNTGRIRNCFFDAKGFTLRRMAHGRVYMCTEKCEDTFLEAHWHMYSGKGLLYSYVAHLSPDGTQLIHTGSEHGYQYNGIPGTENFGKTVHFTEKLVSAEGKLLVNKHPNRVAHSCIYCNEPFAKLFL